MPVRGFNTGTAVGEYMVVYNAIKKHLKDNPPGPEDKKLVDYLHEFGITQYIDISQMTTTVRFDDAHLIGG
jgi:hypothetical protein